MIKTSGDKDFIPLMARSEIIGIDIQSKGYLTWILFL